MALGNVFIKDVDGNIPYETGSSNEKVTGLLFDISSNPHSLRKGMAKPMKRSLTREMYATSPHSSPPLRISVLLSVWRLPTRRR